MAYQNVGVNLSFTADTTQAKRQLQDLQHQLQNLLSSAASRTDNFGLEKDLQDAIGAATQLKAILSSSTNADGLLNISKFTSRLQESGRSLKDYAKDLSALGPEGEKAFLTMTRSIIQAEIPMKRTSKLLNDFAVTLKNTAKWQLSSSMIHGFMSGLSDAYRYAEDLNESLTNIRIVTSASIDEMAKFAEEANKSARALNATTTEYTNASLIFYQQGLDSEQVKKRTDIVVQMANATGEGVEKVSDQLTAIWNNFYDGTKSLEHYADVMTALGAKTASSTDEIAGGLEKFAAVADTIGLSYEYAASALATITSNTRQSEEVVGTALRTIFARIQGLNLGETLDDGTTLNKYSEALQKVGVEIFNQAGELKTMDAILAELGGKWELINKDQQIALAQTVAGVRQYNQLISLLDNWDSGDEDSFLANLETSANSEGTLQEQSEIYAEGWEAASDRVQTAAEGIYQSVLDDQTFIKILNITENLLVGVEAFVDGIGGLKGVLPLIGTLMFRAFGPDIAKSIDRIGENIKNGSEGWKNQILKVRKEAINALSDMLGQSERGGAGNIAGAVDDEAIKSEMSLQSDLLEKTKQILDTNRQLSEVEQERARIILETNRAIGEQYKQTAQNFDQTRQGTEGAIEASRRLFQNASNRQNFEAGYITKDETIIEAEGATGAERFEDALKIYQKLQTSWASGKKIASTFERAINSLDVETDTTSEKFQRLATRVQTVIDDLAKNDRIDLDQNLRNQLESLSQGFSENDINKIKNAFDSLNTYLDELGNNAYEFSVDMEVGMQAAGGDVDAFSNVLRTLRDEFNSFGAENVNLSLLFERLGTSVREGSQNIKEFQGQITTLGDGVSASIQGLSALAMGLSQASSAGEQLFDPDVKPLQKFISVIMLLSSALDTYNMIQKASQTISQAFISSKILATKATKAYAAASQAEKVKLVENTAAVNANKVAWLTHPVLGIIAVALMAIVGIVSAVTSNIEQQNEALKENAQAAKEKVDATKEEIEANKELLKSYEDIYEQYQKGTATKEDLEEATLALCEAYDLENEALLIARGRYEDIAEAARKAREEALEANLAKTRSSITLTESALRTDLYKNESFSFDADSYVFKLKGGMSGSSSIGPFIDKLIEQGKINISRESVEGTFTEKLSTQGDIIDFYEDMLTLQKAIEEENGLLLQSSYYSNLSNWLKESEESYNNLIDLQKTATETSVQLAVGEIDTTSINSIESYLKAESELADKIAADASLGKTAEEAKEIAREALKAETYYAKAASEIEDAAAISQGIATEALQAFYDTLSDDEKLVFTQLSFESASSVSELEEQMGILQTFADQNAIKIRLDAVNAAKELVEDNAKKDLDYEELKAVFENILSWGKDGIMELDSFLSLSAEEMLNYLNGLSHKYNEAIIAATGSVISKMHERRQILSAEIEMLQSHVGSFESKFVGKEGALNQALTLDLENDTAVTAYLQELEKAHGIVGVTKEDIKNYKDYLDELNRSEQEHLKLGEKITAATQERLNYQEKIVHSSLQGIRDASEELRDLISNLSQLSLGESIEPEQFQYLEGILPGLAENFRQTTEGTYQLTKGLDSVIEVYRELAQLKDENGGQLMSDFQIAGYINDQDTLRQAYEEGIISDQAMQTRELELYDKNDTAGLDAEELRDYAEYLQDVAISSGELSDELEKNGEAAEVVAKSVLKMNEGIKKLSDNYDDWADVLKKSTKESEEYASAMDDMRDALADTLDVAEEYIEDDFIASHLDDIKLASEGNSDAIDRLHQALAQDIVLNVTGVDKFENLDTEIQDAITAINERLQNTKFEIGATFSGDDDEFIKECQAIIDSAKMTVADANAYFSQLGFEPVFKTEPQEVTQAVPRYITETEELPPRYIQEYSGVDAGGYPIFTPRKLTRTATYSYQNGFEEFSGTVMVPALSTDGKTPEIKSLTKKASSSMNNYSSKNKGGKSSGGGGGSSKPAATVKKNDVVDRYKEVEDKIDDISDAMDDASKAADRLFGEERLGQMQEQNDLLEKEVELLKEKRKEAVAYLAEDKAALQQAAKAAGVGAMQFDAAGNIANYEEALTKLYKQLSSAITKANKDGNATEAEQKNIDAIQEKIDNLKDAITQYDETRELIEDLDNEITDALYQWQDMNAEMLSYKLELKLELNDMDLERIEYYLGRMENDFYKMAESAALLAGAESSQLESYTKELGDYEQQLDALNEAYARAEISQAAFVEGLKEIQSGLYDNLSSLGELDDRMMEYYSDTLSSAADEMSWFTDRMEHQNDVLDHYKETLVLLGKGTDYAALGEVLQAQLEVAENRAATAKAEFKMYQGQADARYVEYQQALANGDAEAAELYLAQYKAALAAAEEAETAYLERAQAWGEAIKAVLENTMEALAKTLEEALTGGSTFDQLNQQMERAVSLQEEYLTDTNKVYETNKLMRQAQQEIDRTNNTVAKRRLQDFINETAQLKEQTSLSQYELEIQQAKYDLLLAEIALEEAQNAKSMVRLQRDSEGNFGYVYTANSSEVAEAEQQLANAQNALYNIGLEGANDYTEKYQETLSQMYDELTELQQQYLEGQFASEEEYQNAVLATKNYYYDKLKQYSSLYQVALTTDSRVMADAWSTDFQDMIYRTEDWMLAVDDYVQQVGEAFAQYQAQMDKVANETVGPNLEDLSEKTQEIVTNNEILADTITDRVVPAVEAEIDAVTELTGKYATLRDYLKGLVGDYQSLADAIGEETKEEQASKNTPKEETKTEPTTTTAASASDASSSTASAAPSLSVGSYVNVKPGTRWYADSYGGGASGSAKGGQIEYINENGSYAYNIDGKGWVRKKDIVGYDTGGYTGVWGPQGKLAFLHEKELVLKPEDTSNFLNAISILDNILKMIDLQAINAQIGGILSTPGFSNRISSGALEQHVSIEANFPNAQDRNEIEEAFNSLFNQAAQYANR